MDISVGGIATGVTAHDLRAMKALTEGDSNVQLGAVTDKAGLACSVKRAGSFFELTFTLTAMSMAVDDNGAPGSWASQVLFTFAQGGVSYLGSRQNYTAFAEGAALTGEAGDAVFEIGVGSDDIAAHADGVLAADEDDIGGDVNVTLSGGTGVGTGFTAPGVVIDGTTTPATINLNWSGTATTIDADSTISVTGTITVVGVMLGDD